MLAAPLVLKKDLFADVQRDQLLRHRFGVNYIPTPIWQFYWNDWSGSNIARDFDSIASLGADHIRMMLIWPWFQPNPSYVSTAHLDRLDELMVLAAERKLDVVVSLYTGWLSGYAFKPPYLESADFYTDPKWKPVWELYMTEVARRLMPHSNFLGLDLGNEINCCWEGASPADGDPWIESVLPADARSRSKRYSCKRSGSPALVES